MKKINLYITTLSLSFLPFWVSAQDAKAEAAQQAGEFVVKLNQIIIYPTIALLSGIAFLVFVWGCFEYFINAANEQGRIQGMRHITWGIIGLVVMVSAFAILTLVTATFGLDDELACAEDPTKAGCESAFEFGD